MFRLNFLLLFTFILTSNLFSQKKIPIAVMDLSGEGISASETRIITSRLRTDLFNTNRFTVVEREKMNEILDEQGFQLSGCTSNECAVEVGKLLGVRLIVAGDIGKISEMYTISIRLIDVQTGKILRTATDDCECNIKEVLTTSVKTVAQILSGKKVQSSNYAKSNSKDERNLFSNNINEWEILGISRNEYIEYKKSNLSFNDWKKLENPFKSSLKSFVLPGWGQYSIEEYDKAKTSFIIEGIITAGILGTLIYPTTTGDYERGFFEKPNFIVFWGGITLYGMHRIFSSFSAYSLTLKRNIEVGKKKISIYPSYDKHNKSTKLGLCLVF